MADYQSVIDATPRLLLREKPGVNTSDPKLANTPPLIYVVEEDKAAAIARGIDPAHLKIFDMARDAARFASSEDGHGLLYLPYAYLVPGGRFNEMYGWDTAFPVFAYADAEPKIMREQVDNQLYQIRHYGKVLNANRTYYLSRSQPPLIAAMVLHIWQAAQKQPWKNFDPDSVYKDGRDWLKKAAEDLEKYHDYWTTGDRLADGGRLSRYWDEGDMIAPEVKNGEEGHYEHALDRFRKNPDSADEAGLFYNRAADALTPLYYRADRAMRASGLDPTNHWGYGGLQCVFHAPLCLNALIYQIEKDIAYIADILGDSGKAAGWQKKADARKTATRKFLFDPASGQYQDYNFRTKRRNPAPFGTFFHALWAGLYLDPAELKRAVDGVLAALETPHGLLTSIDASGSQWDAPYGWPPLQYFAIEGLRRMGMDDDAKRLAQKFITLAKRVFADKGALFEKYNMVEGNAEVKVMHGYNINVSENGTFLWTASVLKMAGEVA